MTNTYNRFQTCSAMELLTFTLISILINQLHKADAIEKH